MKLNMISFVIVFISFGAAAKSGNSSNLLAVSQGISAPARTSPVNYSNGFTSENAAVASQLPGPQISLQYDTGKDSDGNDQNGVGAELGIGNGKVGAMFGYYDRNCEGCEGRWGGIVGLDAGSFSLGIGYREENFYSVGALIGGNGSSRIGINADFYDAEENEGQDLTSFGVGYSYLGGSWVFALDASKRTEDDGANNDVVMVTPGLLVSANWVSVSISYDLYMNDDNEAYDDQVWFGVGLQGRIAHVAIYHDYVNDWSVVGTFEF